MHLGTLRGPTTPLNYPGPVGPLSGGRPWARLSMGWALEGYTVTYQECPCSGCTVREHLSSPCFHVPVSRNQRAWLQGSTSMMDASPEILPVASHLLPSSASPPPPRARLVLASHLPPATCNAGCQASRQAVRTLRRVHTICLASVSVGIFVLPNVLRTTIPQYSQSIHPSTNGAGMSRVSLQA